MLYDDLDPSWKELLAEEFKKPYMQELSDFLEKQWQGGKKIYPAKVDIFTAFKLTPYPSVKVVILGQDPYHGEGQAHGLCFSVKEGVRPPPSLVNIFKELKADLGLPVPQHGCLESWARQGVLLLNAVLTVEDGQAGSHHSRGWEQFTDKIVEHLNEKENAVFILWGGPAQKKAQKVDPKKHLVLKSVHPSPLSVYRGFFGSRPFSQTNAYLKKCGLEEIDWRLT